IGALLAAPSCRPGGEPTLPKEEQPQPVHVEARGEPASADGDEAGVMTKHAEATPDPYSRAVTTTGPRDIIPGVLSLGPATSETITRFVDGTREAIARSDISSLNILGGVVTLNGLQWEAIHRSGAVNELVGTFSIGGGSQRSVLDPVLAPVLGLLGPASPLPVDLINLLSTVGDVLRPLGINLEMPRAYEAAGSQFVEPLKIGIVPSAVRDNLLNELLQSLQPVREPVIDALFEQDCRTEDLVTVADIAVGTFTGSGDFHAELGGVQATSREVKQSCFLCRQGSSGAGAVSIPPVARTPGTPGTPGTPALPATPAPAATPSAPAVASTTPEQTRKAQPASTEGKRGGAMALVGAIGLGLLAVVAEGDRRKMRKAQRMIPVEA
ncbi:MAG: hypothetical protein ACRD0U_02535, partial [Acidimicrobiales bacterium]